MMKGPITCHQPGLISHETRLGLNTCYGRRRRIEEDEGGGRGEEEEKMRGLFVILHN
jgi:hypothetical protein